MAVAKGNALAIQKPNGPQENFFGVNKIYPNMMSLSIEHLVEYESLLQYSQEYRNIFMLFPECMYIKKIEKVKNPFLKLSFGLRKKFNYNGIKPMLLFHGTKCKYLDNICTYNFDWRRSGLETGHRYGKGVNFTLDPEFAGNFCAVNSTQKVIVVAQVLVLKDCVGKENMNVPPDGYDTTTRQNRRTFVKFSDSEFYPSYIVTFDWNWEYDLD